MTTLFNKMMGQGGILVVVMLLMSANLLANETANSDIRGLPPDHIDVINYSPYRNGQAPGASSPSEDQIREDIRILKKVTGEVRIYGMGKVANTILKVCLQEGMKIHLSAWLHPDKGDGWAGVNYHEVRRLIDAAKDARYRGIIKSLIVGSEVIYRGDVAPSRLLEFINYVKEETAGTGLRVTSAIIYYNWTHELAEAVDYILYHVHPLWEGIHIDQAAGRVIDTWIGMRNKFPAKDIHIGETGWASKGGAQANGVPSEENQLLFINDLFHRVKNHELRKEIKVFIFSAFDENWKASSDEGDIGPNWGLFNEDRTPKLAIKKMLRFKP